MRLTAGCTIVRVRHLSGQSIATHSLARLAPECNTDQKSNYLAKPFLVVLVQTSTSIAQKPETLADIFQILG